jgi:hypothetical protein
MGYSCKKLLMKMVVESRENLSLAQLGEMLVIRLMGKFD